MHVANLLFEADGTGYLEVGETIDLSRAHEFWGKVVDAAEGFQLLVDVDDMLEFLQKPTVDLRQVVDLLYRVATVHGL